MATAPDQTAPSTGPQEPRRRKLGSLRMIWRHARHYPFELLVAAFALGVAALATLAIPWQFKARVDSGFVAGGGDLAPPFLLVSAISGALALAPALLLFDGKSVVWGTSVSVRVE